MDTNGHESPTQVLHGDVVYSIVGCALEVLRELGHGLHEHPHLRITRHRVGVITNFQSPKLEWERLVL